MKNKIFRWLIHIDDGYILDIYCQPFQFIYRVCFQRPLCVSLFDKDSQVMVIIEDVGSKGGFRNGWSLKWLLNTLWKFFQEIKSECDNINYRGPCHFPFEKHVPVPGPLEKHVPNS